ncbi:LOW QUALITY PROTEIN: uncharacterized protein si:ch73-86n18.1 [Scophthalmus maximus]|uniref:LOW QUALITY PROTEIN: uncharacterized protein si:ch73-86n18.1 n=1 Tax=Scophthalmus maximus TaxID=52904 RepID=UPI001FA92B61|nr:LOW QUALITY PROTEIN: uncharacterized protein si:ch73-86n18.1 [Scophthalmus maximus]
MEESKSYRLILEHSHGSQGPRWGVERFGRQTGLPMLIGFLGSNCGNIALTVLGESKRRLSTSCVSCSGSLSMCTCLSLPLFLRVFLYFSGLLIVLSLFQLSVPLDTYNCSALHSAAISFALILYILYLSINFSMMSRVESGASIDTSSPGQQLNSVQKRYIQLCKDQYTTLGQNFSKRVKQCSEWIHVGGPCYYFSKMTSMESLRSRDSCAEMGGHLTTLHTIEQHVHQNVCVCVCDHRMK